MPNPLVCTWALKGSDIGASRPKYIPQGALRNYWSASADSPGTSLVNWRSKFPSTLKEALESEP